MLLRDGPYVRGWFPKIIEVCCFGHRICFWFGAKNPIYYLNLAFYCILIYRVFGNHSKFKRMAHSAF